MNDSPMNESSSHEEEAHEGHNESSALSTRSVALPTLHTKNKNSLPLDAELDRLVHDSSPEVMVAVAGDPRLTEDLALALLNRRDLPREALEALTKNGALAKQRKIRLAIVMHPRAPRHVSVPTVRHLYTFELMQVALLPSVPPDVKRAAEEVLIGRLASISSGERSTLAKQSSGRVAASLLLDREERIMLAALSNAQMTEMWIVKALKTETGTQLLAPAVARHQKWSYRNDIKAALLTNKYTPPARVLQLAAELPINLVKDVLRIGRLNSHVKNCLLAVLEKRVARS
jgi:hypothetical protein